MGAGVLLLQARRSSGGALGDGLWTQSYSQWERLLQVPAQLLVGYQPPLQLVSAGAAALLAGATLALLVARGGRQEHSAAAMAAFVCVIGVGVPMLLAAKGDLSGLTTRYLVGAWVPLVAIAAAGLTTRGSGRVGVAVATALCALFLAVVLGSAWEPKFDRDDWRGAAQALGPAAVARAVVVSPGLGTPALELYLPGSRALRERGEPVREVALVGLPKPFREPGRAAAAAPPRTPRAVTGLREGEGAPGRGVHGRALPRGPASPGPARAAPASRSRRIGCRCAPGAALRRMIAIVVLTHDRVDLLRRCVENVLLRTSDLTTEIVIWDNASSDGTRGYLDGLADARVRVVHHPENLAVNALPRAIRLTTAPYIVELDDDVVEPRPAGTRRCSMPTGACPRSASYARASPTTPTIRRAATCATCVSRSGPTARRR